MYRNWFCSLLIFNHKANVIPNYLVMINFAQWRYTNQWSIREVVLLLVENYSQYPGRTTWNTVVCTNFWPLPTEATNDRMTILIFVIRLYLSIRNYKESFITWGWDRIQDFHTFNVKKYLRNYTWILSKVFLVKCHISAIIMNF